MKTRSLNYSIILPACGAMVITFILCGLIVQGCDKPKIQTPKSINESLAEIQEVVSIQPINEPPKGIAISDFEIYEALVIEESGMNDDIEVKDKWGNVIAMGRYCITKNTWNWACEKGGFDIDSCEWRWRDNAKNPSKCEYLMNVIWYLKNAKTPEQKIRCHRFMNPDKWYCKTANRYYRDVKEIMDVQIITSVR